MLEDAHQCPFISRGPQDERKVSVMWQLLRDEQDPDPMRGLKDPVLLVALSTSIQQYRVLYSQARELAKFMLKRMEFTKAATLYSSSMPPLVMISEDGIMRLSSTSFHRYTGGARDIILLAGDASPLDDQYEFCDAVLDYAEAHGVREMISVGTRWTEEAGSPTATPAVKGFGTDAKSVGELQRVGVEIIREEPAPFFASLIVALAQQRGMRGYKLSVDHGEPVPHPRSIKEILGVLQKMLDFQVDTADLDSVAERLAANLDASAVVAGQDPSQRRPAIYG